MIDKLCVYVKTQDEWNKVQDLLFENKCRWVHISGKANYWERYGKQTVLAVTRNQIEYGPNTSKSLLPDGKLYQYYKLNAEGFIYCYSSFKEPTPKKTPKKIIIYI